MSSAGRHTFAPGNSNKRVFYQLVYDIQPLANLGLRIVRAGFSVSFEKAGRAVSVRVEHCEFEFRVAIQTPVEVENRRYSAVYCKDVLAPQIQMQ